MVKRTYRPAQSVHCHRREAAKALDRLHEAFPDRNRADLVEAVMVYATQHVEELRPTLEAVVPPRPTGGKRRIPRTGDYLTQVDLVRKDQALAATITTLHPNTSQGQGDSRNLVIEAAMRFGLFAFRELPDIAKRMIAWERKRRHRFIYGPTQKAQRNTGLREALQTSPRGYEVSLEAVPERHLADSPEHHLG